MQRVLIVAGDPERHAGGVQAIFNDVIANSTALYEYRPRDLATVEAWFRARAESGWPVLVAETGGGDVAGFASYGVFRPFPAYRYTVEHSVYVQAASRGLGIGRVLLEALVRRAEASGVHVMVGGIDAGNAASIRLHERQGFTHAGTIRAAGYKFGRWLDLAFYQRQLAGPAEPRED